MPPTPALTMRSSIASSSVFSAAWAFSCSIRRTSRRSSGASWAPHAPWPGATPADTELVWSVNPSHPITAGIPQPIVINEHEMYGEFFDIPVPDELIFLSAFSSGEVFRSGCCWRRGKGKVFYFSPGDQDYPVYHHPDIKRVLANAVLWARPEQSTDFAEPGVVSQPAPRFNGRLVGEGVHA